MIASSGTKSKTLYIRFFADVNPQSAKELMDHVQAALTNGYRRFVLLISCAGGSVLHGLTAYNFLKGIPAEVETHNFGSVISMGVVLFCAGKKRFSSPHATFLIHGVQMNFQSPTSLEEKQLEEKLKSLQIDQENIAGVIASTCNKKEQDVAHDMHARITLNPEQAQNYGLIHGIREELIEPGAEVVTISY